MESETSSAIEIHRCIEVGRKLHRWVVVQLIIDGDKLIMDNQAPFLMLKISWVFKAVLKENRQISRRLQVTLQTPFSFHSWASNDDLYKHTIIVTLPPPSDIVLVVRPVVTHRSKGPFLLASVLLPVLHPCQSRRYGTVVESTSAYS